jgi:hypothetical protein
MPGLEGQLLNAGDRLLEARSRFSHCSDAIAPTTASFWQSSSKLQIVPHHWWIIQ